MGKHTSPASKAKIVTLVGHMDLNYEEVAEQVERDPTTVSYIYKWYQKTHDCNHVELQSGCPCKLTKANAQFAAFKINSDSTADASQLQQEFFPQVLANTVRRRLKEQGLDNYAPCQVPSLTAKHIPQQLEWGEDMISWTQENWAAVIYSDASQFKVFGSNAC